MTPPTSTPPGSITGSSREAVLPESAEPSSSSEHSSTESATPSEIPHPISPWADRFSLGGEFHYELSGQGGSPFRGGILAGYQFGEHFRLRARLDTNFTDEVSGGLRAEGVLPFGDSFALFGALEGSVRGLFNQTHDLGAAGTREVSAVLLGVGVEGGVEFRPLPELGIEIFINIIGYPDQGVTYDNILLDNRSSPPSGDSWGGIEAQLGLRLILNLETGSSSRHESGDVVADATPLVQAQSTLAAMHETLDDLDDDDFTPVVTTPPDADGTDGSTPEISPSEELDALKHEIERLERSTEDLEIEIGAATRDTEALNDGYLNLQDFSLRRDRIHDGLLAHPPAFARDDFASFVTALTTALHDDANLRRVLNSATDTLAPQFLRNLESLQRDMERLSRRLSLSTEVEQLVGLIARVRTLREHPADLRPSVGQITVWRETLESIHRRVEILAPCLSEENAETLRGHATTLARNFSDLCHGMEVADQVLLTGRAITDHFYRFREAVAASPGHPHGNPTQATAALRSILDELNNAPGEYAEFRERHLVNLGINLQEFILQQSSRPQPRYAETREAAIAVIRLIDPSYTPPEVRRRPRVDPDADATTPRDPNPSPPPPTPPPPPPSSTTSTGVPIDSEE